MGTRIASKWCPSVNPEIYSYKCNLGTLSCLSTFSIFWNSYVIFNHFPLQFQSTSYLLDLLLLCFYRHAIPKVMSREKLPIEGFHRDYLVYGLYLHLPTPETIAYSWIIASLDHIIQPLVQRKVSVSENFSNYLMVHTFIIQILHANW